jgi:hypothetical protein
LRIAFTIGIVKDATWRATLRQHSSQTLEPRAGLGSGLLGGGERPVALAISRKIAASLGIIASII